VEEPKEYQDERSDVEDVWVVSALELELVAVEIRSDQSIWCVRGEMIKSG
jgi:hypothetical protein